MRVAVIGQPPALATALCAALPDDVVLHPNVDLHRPRVIHDLLSSMNVDTVVHLGPPDVAHALVTECAKHPAIRRFVYRSTFDVYQCAHATTTLIDEDAPLATGDHVVADLDVLSHNGPPLEVAVLRLAELVAPNTNSQLWDYVASRVCLRPLGFDPMINVLSLADATEALVRAIHSHATGVFNIPGATTLPLSYAVQLAGRADVPIANALIGPLYRLRRRITGFEFRYELNLQRFHVGGILDGTRARDELGYVPRTPVRWPQPWWRELLARLGDRSGDHDARTS